MAIARSILELAGGEKGKDYNTFPAVYWDIYQWWSREPEMNRQRNKILVDYCNNAIQGKTSVTVFDGGCGSGVMEEGLLVNKDVSKIIAVDSEATMVEGTQRLLEGQFDSRRFQIVQSDLVSMLESMEGVSIDLIILLKSIFFLPVPQRENAIRNAVRVLKPKGKILISDAIDQNYDRISFLHDAIRLQVSSQGVLHASRFIIRNMSRISRLFSELPTVENDNIVFNQADAIRLLEEAFVSVQKLPPVFENRDWVVMGEKKNFED